MTINDLITKIRAEKPNSFTDANLYSFINQIEAEVAEQLNASPKVYTWTSASVNDGTKVLLAKPPYDRLYVSWLKAQIDYDNEEYESYANNQAQHVSDFRDFVDWTVRNGSGPSNHPRRFINCF